MPFSTWGRNASCWALLKRWISSMKTIVRVPYCRARSASAITCLISLIPASTALNSMKSARVIPAIIFASVVLPVPGGPQKISELMSSRSIWTRSGLPGAIRCSCPTNSSRFPGRMRSARGRVRSAGLSPASWIGRNKLIGCSRLLFRASSFVARRRSYAKPRTISNRAKTNEGCAKTRVQLGQVYDARRTTYDDLLRVSVVKEVKFFALPPRIGQCSPPRPHSATQRAASAGS